MLTGGLCLQCIPLGFVLKPPSQEDRRTGVCDSHSNKRQSKYDAPKTTSQRVYCSMKNAIVSYRLLLWDVRCDIFIVGSVVALTGMQTLVGHTPNRAVQSGIDKTRAATLMSFLGLGSLFGRLLFSIVANSERVSTVLCFGVATVFGGAATAAMYWTQSFTGLAIGVTLGGCFLGQ